MHDVDEGKKLLSKTEANFVPEATAKSSTLSGRASVESDGRISNDDSANDRNGSRQCETLLCST